MPAYKTDNQQKAKKYLKLSTLTKTNSMTLKSVLLLVFAACLLQTASAQTTLYVNPATGTDAGAGSQEKPLKSLGK